MKENQFLIITKISFSQFNNLIIHNMWVIYFVYVYMLLGHWPMSRVFVDGLGDRGSIPGQVIPKTQKMIFDAILLSTQRYKVRIKGNPRNGRAPSPTPRCSSY